MVKDNIRIEDLREELHKARARVVEQDLELAALRKELYISRSLLAEKDAALHAVYRSTSWYLTAPIRLAKKLALALLRRPAPMRAMQAPMDNGEMVAAMPRRASLAPPDASEMVAAASRTCIFAHHDRDAVLSDYVLELLRGISSLGHEILFVTTTKDLPESDYERLSRYCARIYSRENTGRDFGSWQFGLRRLTALENLDWLLLANDSVFGPFFDLSDMAEQMEQPGLDFWGVTDSYQGRWHLQSYFLCFRGDVVRSEAFQSLFTKDFAKLSKRQVIDEGEIGLSQALIAAGYRGAAFCPYEALDEGRYDFSRNPTHYFWDKLITKARCPFLKIELLRDNPSKQPRVDRYREIISAVSDYELDWIEAQLKRAAGFRQAKRPSKA